MMKREELSVEALKRAIRARLARAHGIMDPIVVVPIRIDRREADDTGLNWGLDVRGMSDELASELEWASTEVKRKALLH